MSTGDSSSEEDTEKLKEATWNFGPAKTNGCQTEHAKNGTQSRRTVVSEHEHDGNELQTTPEFRAHVAKKLGAVLDGCISEVSTATVNTSRSLSGQEKEDEDEGFRLFSTSVPGMSSAPPPAPSLKRRPVPSSSDSDSEMEMRFKQAAVSISDIVRPYYTEKTVEKTDSTETQENKADGCESVLTKKKKKKKKKKVPMLEENEDQGQESFADGNVQMQDSGQPAKLKKKKKKKKQTDLNPANGE